MPRGKTTSAEDVYRIMTAYANNPNNINDLSKKLGMPESTVRKVVKANKDKAEFAKLCDDKKKEFIDKASVIIDKALIRLERMIDNKDENITANQLTTAIGTLYDKRALSQGDATQNHSITFVDNVVEDEEKVFADDI